MTSSCLSLRCHSPAKLILTGEHAVIYGVPAISLAIQLSTQVNIQFTPQTNSHFDIHLIDFKQQHVFSFDEWTQQSANIEKRYQAFLQQQQSIDDVLQSPFDLVLITLSTWQQKHALPSGHWQIQIQSDIPIGRGLGSSAAVITALLSGLNQACETNQNTSELLTLARHIENYQHGQSSGLDPATQLQGGAIRFTRPDTLQSIALPNLSAWLIDSGEPLSQTGECVEHVKQHFAENSELWEAFTTVSQTLEQAWRNQNKIELKQTIRKNHQLLTQIGVVPQNIQSFIQKLEKNFGAAAKICGAGSIAGQHAGMLLCVSDTSPETLCQEYGYSVQPLSIQQQGVQCELV